LRAAVQGEVDDCHSDLLEDRFRLDPV
jgi:hypothetical protein